MLCGQLAVLTRALVHTQPSNEPVSPAAGIVMTTVTPSRVMVDQSRGLMPCQSRLTPERQPAAEARARATHTHTAVLSPQEPVVSEEVELIVESLLGVLLRTILEISNRPQPPGPPMRLQVQDVTVRVFDACARVRARARCKLFWDLT